MAQFISYSRPSAADAGPAHFGQFNAQHSDFYRNITPCVLTGKVFTVQVYAGLLKLHILGGCVILELHLVTCEAAVSASDTCTAVRAPLVSV